MSISTRKIEVNGYPREMVVRREPYPVGTQLLVDGQWFRVASHECEITELLTLDDTHVRATVIEQRTGDEPV